MKRRGPELRAVLLAAVASATSLLPACTWHAWIPATRPPSPEIRLATAPRSEPLLLDTHHVGDLACYAPRCQQRFRLGIRAPGELRVQVVAELASQDDQLRIVLEGTQGALAQDESGRGPRDGATLLSLREAVQAGAYFVLLESAGGPVPYQLTASLTPEAKSAPAPSAAPASQPEPPPPEGPAPRLVAVDLPGVAGGGYDPAVSFEGLRTFTFPRRLTPEEAMQYGVGLEEPIDREIRRLLADELSLKGLRQATGSDPADLIVDFSRSRTTRVYYRDLPFVYAWYDLDPAIGAFYRKQTDTRATLTVDLIEKRSRRIAWHAWTTKGVGPGITYGAKSAALLREAVSDVLSGFPPR